MVEKPTASIVTVTPDMAEHWLTLNVKNRPKKPKNIERFARDMSNGDWQITGEAIKFDTDGHLSDGQNRLTAVVLSGATVDMFVVRGLAPEAQEVMDSGALRSASDSLTLRGVANAKDVAPVVTNLMAWESDFYNHCMTQSSPTYTKTEIYKYLEDHPDIPEIVQWVKRVQRQLPLPIGSLGGCAYRFSLIDADDATDFYERIHQLHTSGKGDPIYTLIKRASDDRTIKRRLSGVTVTIIRSRPQQWPKHFQPTVFPVHAKSKGSK